MTTIPTHGPYAAACTEVEFLEGESVDPDKHLVGRLFYPADKAAVGHGDRFPRPSWIPSFNFARGIGVFATSYMAEPRKSLLRTLAQSVLYVLGQARAIDLFQGAALARPVEGEAFPVVIFSHGIGGARYLYSTFCAQLASAGFVVLAVEHADGTASAVQLAGKRGWKYYSGWGDTQEQTRQTRWRLREMATAKDLLGGLARGEPHPRLRLGGRATGGPLHSALRGSLNMDALVAAGHSYGGATAAAMAAEDKAVRACVTFDPWWGALPADSPALSGWVSQAPILVMGSQAWNTPTAKGNLFCGAERQAALFTAVSRGAGSGSSSSRAGHERQKGPGAVHLVLEGSRHDTFYDGGILLALRYRWILKQTGRDTGLDPLLGLDLISRSMLAFLGRHLALPPRQAQALSDVALRGRDADVAASLAAQRRSEAQVQPRGGTLQAASSGPLGAALEETLPLVDEALEQTMGRSNQAAAARSVPAGGSSRGEPGKSHPTQAERSGQTHAGPQRAEQADLDVLRRIAGPRAWRLDLYT